MFESIVTPGGQITNITKLLYLLPIETIEPEYENEEIVEENTRQEKKIDPLVVDVERKPFKPDFSDMEDSKKPSEVEEQPEGRFFLKDKLCALGLADVSTTYLCTF